MLEKVTKIDPWDDARLQISGAYHSSDARKFRWVNWAVDRGLPAVLVLKSLRWLFVDIETFMKLILGPRKLVAFTRKGARVVWNLQELITHKGGNRGGWEGLCVTLLIDWCSIDLHYLPHQRVIYSSLCDRIGSLSLVLHIAKNNDDEPASIFGVLRPTCPQIPLYIRHYLLLAPISSNDLEEPRP
jgi:hypothetical protein